VQAWEILNPKKDPELAKFKKSVLNTFYKYMGDDETPADPGKMFNFLARNTKPVMAGLTGGSAAARFRTLDGLYKSVAVFKTSKPDKTIERMYILQRRGRLAVCWRVQIVSFGMNSYASKLVTQLMTFSRRSRLLKIQSTTTGSTRQRASGTGGRQTPGLIRFCRLEKNSVLLRYSCQQWIPHDLCT
jgi:hypothetical protein